MNQTKDRITEDKPEGITQSGIADLHRRMAENTKPGAIIELSKEEKDYLGTRIVRPVHPLQAQLDTIRATQVEHDCMLTSLLFINRTIDAKLDRLLDTECKHEYLGNHEIGFKCMKCGVEKTA